MLIRTCESITLHCFYIVVYWCHIYEGNFNMWKYNTTSLIHSGVLVSYLQWIFEYVKVKHCIASTQWCIGVTFRNPISICGGITLHRLYIVVYWCHIYNGKTKMWYWHTHLTSLQWCIGVTIMFQDIKLLPFIEDTMLMANGVLVLQISKLLLKEAST